MKLSKGLMLAASAVAITGSALAVGGASAATEHCSTADFPNKVELDGTSSSVDTGLAPGTVVCIKAGTTTVEVVVDASGFITNTITNANGNARGISYYAYGEGYEPPPCVPPYCS